MAGTFWALVPPIVAIVLALITKETYTSLFVGILVGALFVGGFNPVASLDTMISDGFIGAIADGWNAGIFMFLVLLGILVALVNTAGGSAAFGRWAVKHVHTRTGAMLATFLLGVLIFIDDYFNCLTVGSVMRPVSDSQKISREKLAYIIDATAAPVCMIAPVSSWAAAVSATAQDLGSGISGIQLFIRAIPYNFYSLLTIVFVIAISVMGFDYGPMAKAELRARQGELGALSEEEEQNVPGASIWDMLIPVILLIVFCIVGMMYVGGFWSGASVIDSFADTDASVGLPWGCIVALMITFVYLLCRRVITFKEASGCITKGFLAMVPAMLILTFALTLKNMTGLLGAADYVAGLVEGAAAQPRAADDRHLRVPGRRRLRRPLLAHLRYDHHGLRGCERQPHRPRLHAAALRPHRGGRQLCVLPDRGLRAELGPVPGDRRGPHGRRAVLPAQPSEDRRLTNPFARHSEPARTLAWESASIGGQPGKAHSTDLTRPGGKTDCHVASLLAMTRDGLCLQSDRPAFRRGDVFLPEGLDFSKKRDYTVKAVLSQYKRD